MLCILCDDPLLSDVDPRYWAVHDVLIKEGKVQPSSKNPRHLDLPLWWSFEACQFHQESRQSDVANGIAVGYPTYIDFGAIPSCLEPKLTAIKTAILWPLLPETLEEFQYGNRPAWSLAERMAFSDASHAG